MNKNEQDGLERRKDPRLDANFIISYSVADDGQGYDLTQSKNVSKGGVLLTTNRKFSAGTILSVTVRFPFVRKRIELVGEVIDSKEVARNLVYNTRVRFRESDNEFFKELGDFINTRI